MDDVADCVAENEQLYPSAVVFAPHGDDANGIAMHLASLRVASLVCDSPDALRAAMDGRVGIVVLSEEALTPATVDIIDEHLKTQEPWTEVPLIAVVDPSSPSTTTLSELGRRLPRAPLAMVPRPILRPQFESAVRTAIDTRIRQFAIERQVAGKDELRRELNHRVKNALASVQALVGLSLRSAVDLATFADDFQSRLQAFSAVQDLLYRMTDEPPTLGNVVSIVTSPFETRESRRINPSGKTISLKPEPALMIGLAMHELTTNAVKYGALSCATGSIEILWNVQGEGRDRDLELRWVERGGPPVSVPDKVGYGTTFIRFMFESRFRGSVDLSYAPAGFEGVIRLPAERILL